MWKVNWEWRTKRNVSSALGAVFCTAILGTYCMVLESIQNLFTWNYFPTTYTLKIYVYSQGCTQIEYCGLDWYCKVGRRTHRKQVIDVVQFNGFQHWTCTEEMPPQKYLWVRSFFPYIHVSEKNQKATIAFIGNLCWVDPSGICLCLHHLLCKIGMKPRTVSWLVTRKPNIA